LKTINSAIISALLVTGCSNTERPYNYVMDYPVSASRLSLSGTVIADIDCDRHDVKIISDTSDGIFSRHIVKRVNGICYKKAGSYTVEFVFDPERGPKHNMLATQANRVPPV